MAKVTTIVNDVPGGGVEVMVTTEGAPETGRTPAMKVGGLMLEVVDQCMKDAQYDDQRHEIVIDAEGVKQ